MSKLELFSKYWVTFFTLLSNITLFCQKLPKPNAWTKFTSQNQMPRQKLTPEKPNAWTRTSVPTFIRESIAPSHPILFTDSNWPVLKVLTFHSQHRLFQEHVSYFRNLNKWQGLTDISEYNCMKLKRHLKSTLMYLALACVFSGEHSFASPISRIYYIYIIYIIRTSSTR